MEAYNKHEAMVGLQRMMDIIRSSSLDRSKLSSNSPERRMLSPPRSYPSPSPDRCSAPSSYHPTSTNSTSKVSVTPPLKSTKEEGTISCGVCCNVMQTPLVLNCGHCFCASCLMAKAADGRVQCALCDTSQPIPRADHELAHRIASLLASGGGGEAINMLCDWCESASAETYCDECGFSLCGKCVQVVHSRRRTSGHVVVDIASAVRQPRCPRAGHERAPLKYHCRSCSRAACATCVAEDCRGHTISTASEVAAERKGALKSKEKELTGLKHQLSELVAGNQQTKAQFNATAVVFEQQVHHVFAAIQRALHREEQEILANFQKLYNDGRSTLVASSEELLHALDEVHVQLHRISQAIKNGCLTDPAGHLLQQSPASAGIMVPRGEGFSFKVPDVTLPDVGSLFNLRLSLRQVPLSSTYAMLSFDPQDEDSNIKLSPSFYGGTEVHFTKLTDWASLKAKQVFTKGTHKWKVRLCTFSLMVGVVRPNEDRPDLHNGQGFFWYCDISGSSYGSLGTATSRLERIPPLPTLAAADKLSLSDKDEKSVELVLTYNADACTLSAEVNGCDKGIIGEGITPPVSPAFAFISGEQWLFVCNT